MQRLLITGGSGLLALNWAREMSDLWQVHLVLNRRVLRLSRASAEVVALDSPAFGELLDRVRPHLLVNAAGLTDVEACERDPEAARLANAAIPAKIADHAVRRDIDLVHISTDHLFDGDRPMLDEAEAVSPVNAYAASKAEGEAAVLSAAPNALVARTNFYGWGPSYRPSFSDRILSALRERREITLFDDVHFTPIEVGALARSLHDLLQAGAHGIYNVVGDERLSKYEFGLRVADIFGLDADPIRRGRIVDHAGLTRRPREMSLSNRKAAGVLRRSLGSSTEHLRRLQEIEGDPRVKEVRQL